MMKILDVVKFMRACALILILVMMTAWATFAQNANGNATNRADRGNDRTETTRVVERDNDFDWGWLGLLGLLGLAGLIPKKRKVEVQEFRDVNRSASNTETTH